MSAAATGAVQPQQATAGMFALLTDGSTVAIRPAQPEDADAVRGMHDAMSLGNLYLRFFSFSPRCADTEPARVCRATRIRPRGAARLAW